MRRQRHRTRGVVAWLLCLAVGLVGLTRSELAHAGDRRLYVAIVPVEIEGADARRCLTRIKAHIQQDYTARAGMQLPTLGRVVGLPEGEWRHWPATAAKPALDRKFKTWRVGTGDRAETWQDSRPDAIALIRCRPAAQKLEVVVYANNGAGAHRIRIQGVPIEAETSRWAADMILAAGWANFSP